MAEQSRRPQGSGRPAPKKGAAKKPYGSKPAARKSTDKPYGDRPAKRTGSKPTGDAPRGERSKSWGDKPASRSGAAKKTASKRPYGAADSTGRSRPARDERPARRDDRPAGKRPARDDRAPRRDDRAPRRDDRAPREREPRSEDQQRYDGPDLPDFITGQELDRSVAAQLRGLPDKLALRVARHLAAAGHFIDDNPELAYQHAKAAKSRAQRLAVVREALGEAAYASGHYDEALAELRAAKRMNGATAYLPIMADCHRALGQPQQAIKLAHSPSVVNFAPEAKTEMTLVESGARRDMGQLDAALRVLEASPLNTKSRAPWVVRLRYAYADTLEAAGRLPEAREWFHRAFAMDSEEITDAEQRAEALDKRLDTE